MATKSVSIRFEEEMLKKISYIAEYEGRSVNSEVLCLVRDRILAFEREHDKIEGTVAPCVPPISERANFTKKGETADVGKRGGCDGERTGMGASKLPPIAVCVQASIAQFHASSIIPSSTSSSQLSSRICSSSSQESHSQRGAP